MAYLPKNDLDQVCNELADEASERMIAHSSSPHVVGALPLAISVDVMKKFTRVSLDLVVQLAGPLIESGVIASKDQLKEFASPAFFAFVDKLVHDVKDAS